MLFRFFLLLAVVGLRSAIEDQDKAARARALLSLVNCVNVVIIGYSVDWWNLLHQPGSPVAMSNSGANVPKFWLPMPVMIVTVYLFLAASLILTTRNEILQREGGAQWVQRLVAGS